MNVILTICSANYLAHAKVLGDSLTATNPDYHLVIGLVDEVPNEIDVPTWLPYEVVPVTCLGIPEFQEMAEKYDIVELNTAVKPFYLEYLYRRDPAVMNVIYLDPDIVLYGSLRTLSKKLQTCNAVVVPHNCTYDNSETNVFYEISMLSTGIYNLGFIGTSRTDVTFAFLKWWQTRLIDHCFYEVGWGAFVDQQWVTLAPLYFDGFFVEKNPGYNMSYWNHFERRLSVTDQGYVVNGTHELIFYHFSNYSPLRPDVIANRCREYTESFEQRGDLQAIYDDYCQRLLDSDFLLVKDIPCFYGRKDIPVCVEDVPIGSPARTLLKRGLRLLPGAARMPLKRLAGFVANNCEC